jgi:hypothetical protein
MKRTPSFKDYENQSFASRLQMLSRYWQKSNEGALKHRQKMLKAYASGYYDSGYTRRHILNLIDRGVSSITPFLVEGDPRVLVKTEIPKFRGWAYTIQLALNFLINKLSLAENVLIPAAINSMFGFAITRSAFEYDRTISLLDEPIKYGRPIVELIDDTEYIGDCSAKRVSDFTFEGDIYRLPTIYAKDFFAKKDRWGHQTADDITSDGKLIEQYSPQEISQIDYDRDRLALRNYTTFIDLYLYDENTIVTIMPHGKKAKILREVEWKGPEGGPYDKLWYKGFPNEPTPLPPAWSWNDLDETINILMDKMKEQAEAQKDIVAYSAEAEEDVKRMVKTPNQGTVRVDNVDAMKKLEFGGVNPLNYQWVTFAEQQFTKSATPSSDVIGGRGSQAPTLGQEQLIFSNATRIINNMYNRFHRFTVSIIRKLAWQYITDPTTIVPVVKEISGVGEFPAIFSDTYKVGDFYDFVFDIVPYSTQRTSPEMQYQRLMQFLTQWVLPTAQIASAQGTQIDVSTVSKILASYIGETSLNQWYKTAVPSEMEGIAYKMLPFGKSPGQGNDSTGATLGSKNANLNRQQTQEAPQQELNNMMGVK